jgi:hypothetical protein
MKRLLFLAIAFVAVTTVLAINSSEFSPSTQATQETKPTPQLSRKLKGRKLISTQLPAVQLEFDKAFKYAGGQNFILYDVANAEQHFFVDADNKGRIKRFYWIQFEGYLPGNTHTYRYKANKTVDIGGLNFVADAFPRNIKMNTGRPDSDGSRAQAFLQSKGYRMASDEVLMQRLVHLVDEAKRNELMIIYMEDLSGMGLTAADLGKDGAAAARWDEISKALLDRAVKGIKISRA